MQAQITLTFNDEAEFNAFCARMSDAEEQVEPPSQDDANVTVEGKKKSGRPRKDKKTDAQMIVPPAPNAATQELMADLAKGGADADADDDMFADLPPAGATVVRSPAVVTEGPDRTYLEFTNELVSLSSAAGGVSVIIKLAQTHFGVATMSEFDVGGSCAGRHMEFLAMVREEVRRRRTDEKTSGKAAFANA